ncbi:MAG: thiosulfate oxidation carrier complex protein SoxZ [Gammaproteobacteria bacterium]|nr:thiosulfate oxidation carrier complex protein SoxZ [Gammaproteobacteria bacterium]MDJ0870655.1 thiosulfate oxidation carrier complex protein SoxZ [Gammaproteobacteria bacterium]MDJ0891079.1 thiosulfate oxidation carrier complex protein SoxZ [Gammaproteobacteria bacterium]
MAKGIKIRAKAKEGVTTVKALISHPMETGGRKDKKTGNTIPAHFIQEVKVSVNGEDALTGHWSGGVSKNPYLSVKVAGANKGDTVTIAWVDNKGGSASGEAKVK